MRSSWEEKTLGELCTFSRGLTYKKADEDESSSSVVLRANNIDLTTHTLCLDELKRIKDEITIPDSKKVKKGSLLICTASGSKAHLGKVALIDADYDYAFGGFMGQLTPADSIHSKYFYYLLTSDSYKKFIGELSDGANINNLKFSQLENFRIPVPPLGEQERIVAILDEAFAGIDSAIANTKNNLANTRELFNSVLDSAFDNKYQGKVYLEEALAVQPKNGWSPPAKNHAPSGTPVLTLSSVTGFRFRSDKIKFTSAEVDLARHYWVENCDLLITRSNTPELVGHVAIASGLDVKTIYPDLIMRMKPHPKKALTKFIFYQLRAPSLREEIMSRAQGANPTMKKIGKRAVQTLPITLPPLSEQEAAVSWIESIADECERLESIYQQKLDALNELKNSLLRKAFSGELIAKCNDKNMDDVVA